MAALPSAPFEIEGDAFLRNGAPHRILSGAFHYFRVHPGQWERRLRMLLALGLNTVETYVPWNLHERERGRFDFSGIADLEAFLDLAADLGLDAIVRPGPYICAEWDNGGLPEWLTGTPGLKIRCMDVEYLAAVDTWFDELIPRIVSRQVTHGGNVVMVQVENEYGSYGSDHAYLGHLRDGLLRRGVSVPLFTSDGPENHMLTGGSLDGVLATVNFGGRAKDAFAVLERFRPGQPKFCMEFWDGWFDHWGEVHVTRPADDAAAVLEEILRAGGSVNLYMAHGGTNFGTWAGANRGGPLYDGELQADVTSYDYDAPIDEQGLPTEKFWAFRSVLERFRREIGDVTPLPDPPEPEPELDPATVTLRQGAALLSTGPFSLDRAHRSAHPPRFEELGIRQGLAVYRTVIPGPRPPLSLRVDGVRDRISVFVDGSLVCRSSQDVVEIDLEAVPASGTVVTFLVESAGRANYGPLVGELKGITGTVRHERQLVHGFESWAWEADRLPEQGGPAQPLASELVGPGFLHGAFDAEGPADGWLRVGGAARGLLYVNGVCLGRFDAAGPQQTLFLPAPIVRAGENRITVLDLEPDEAREATVMIGAKVLDDAPGAIAPAVSPIYTSPAGTGEV